MFSTGRLLPMSVDEIPQTATWSHCLAHCLLERETIDFSRSQLKNLEVDYQKEEQVIQQRRMELNFKETEPCRVYGVTPQQFISPGYFTQKRHQEYLHRRNSRKMNRKKKQQEKYQKKAQDAKKTAFEVLSELKRFQTNRRKEVTERQSVYVSQASQEDEWRTVECRIDVLPSWDAEEVQDWGLERKGITPFLMLVYWISCRLLRALFP
ncbi:hypothetical protein DFH28DRAFT_947561 [Melampsora americana]|nr:hypothetical protein DFH28DRAFT_947561 [Melampsora americana]